MGLSDKVKAEQEKENSAKSKTAAFFAMGGSENDPIAVELTEEQKSLLQEVIEEVPENMWETISHNVISIRVGDDIELHAPGIKYIDPDGKLRLTGTYLQYFHRSEQHLYSSKHADMEHRISQLPEIGSLQAVIFEAGGYVRTIENLCGNLSNSYVIFRDGTFFAKGKNIAQFPEEEVFVKGIKLLIEESEKRKSQAEQQERESLNWASKGLCKYCGGKLSVFGKKCKSCGEKN